MKILITNNLKYLAHFQQKKYKQKECGFFFSDTRFKSLISVSSFLRFSSVYLDALRNKRKITRVLRECRRAKFVG